MGGGRDHWAAAPRTRFLLLSVALHAALLLAWHEPLTLAMPAAPGGPGGVLSVQTVTHRPAEQPSPAPASAEPRGRPEPEAEAHSPQQTSTPTTERKQRQSGSPVPEAVTTAAPNGHRVASESRQPAGARDSADAAETTGSSQSQPAPTGKQDARESEASPRPAGGSTAGAPGQAEARNRVRAELRDSLARHFEYPHSARRRGWEGRVVLRLTVHTDGRIDDVAVSDSSGYAVLDRSAARALRRISRLPAGRRPGTTVENLRIPVVYRLEG